MPDDRKSILLVEDEALIALSEAAHLRAEGYAVIHVPTGERAVEIVAAGREGLDMILMDIRLGDGMDGTRAARAILGLIDIPILFLSSHIELEIVARTEGIANYGYVVKSTTFTVLDASIKAAFKLFEARARETSRSGAPLAGATPRRDLRTSGEGPEAADCLRMTRAILESSTKGLERVFLMAIDAGYSYLYFNQAYRDMILGRSGIEPRIGEAVSAEDTADTFIKTSLPYFERAFCGESSKVTQRLRSDDSYYETVYNPIRASGGEILGATAFATDITERERAERALSEETNKRRAMFEQSPDGILIIDTETAGFVEFNTSAHKGLGYSREEFERLGIFDVEAQESREETKERIASVIRNGRADFETLQRTKQGELRNVLVTAQLLEVAGRPVYHCIWRDITERKRSEEQIRKLLQEKEILISEVHHRVKNDMSIIVSLLSIQARIHENRTAKGILMDAAGRADSMMVLYDKLYQSMNVEALPAKEYLPALIDEIIGVFPNRSSVRVVNDIDDIVLRTRILAPLGIIVNEIVTNAMKYAFVGRDDGVMALSVSRRGKRVWMRFEDNGVGLPESVSFEKPVTFGLRLIGMLVKQIDGAISVERRRGTRYLIEFDE